MEKDIEAGLQDLKVQSVRENGLFQSETPPQKKEISLVKEIDDNSKDQHINVKAKAKIIYKSEWTGLFQKTYKDPWQLVYLMAMFATLFFLVQWSADSLKDLGYVGREGKDAYALAILLETFVVFGTFESLREQGKRKILAGVFTVTVIGLNYALMTRKNIALHTLEIQKISSQERQALAVDSTVFDELIKESKKSESSLTTEIYEISQKTRNIKEAAEREIAERPNFVTRIKTQMFNDVMPLEELLGSKEKQLSEIRESLRTWQDKKAFLIAKNTEIPREAPSAAKESLDKKTFLAHTQLGVESLLRLVLILGLAYLLHLFLLRREGMLILHET